MPFHFFLLPFPNTSFKIFQNPLMIPRIRKINVNQGCVLSHRSKPIPMANPIAVQKTITSPTELAQPISDQNRWLGLDGDMGIDTLFYLTITKGSRGLSYHLFSALWANRFILSKSVPLPLRSGIEVGSGIKQVVG